MGEPKVPPIGPRIRAQRARRDVTIRALARDIGVSPSLISQIETGKSQPSVSTLYAITSALDLPLEDLFDAEELEEPAAMPAAVGATSLRYFGTDRARGVGPHVTPEDRELLTLESGVTWERLGQVPHHHVDFLLVTYQPGSTSSSDGRLMRHSGTEYGYLINGELKLTLGFDQHVLAPGDSICFESTTPHGYRNDGEVPAVGVWFVVEQG
ncbi:MAG TPA: cupin domain-containing protein [Propionibacteriaceae bacterium]|nr:cupin domain-containing protein [Propionibacteriaceae bacterium]